MKVTKAIIQARLAQAKLDNERAAAQDEPLSGGIRGTVYTIDKPSKGEVKQYRNLRNGGGRGTFRIGKSGRNNPARQFHNI